MIGIDTSLGRSVCLQVFDEWRDSGSKEYETLRQIIMSKFWNDWSTHPFAAMFRGGLGLGVHNIICDAVTKAVITQLNNPYAVNNSDVPVNEIVQGVLCGVLLVKGNEVQPVWMVIIASKDGAFRLIGQLGSSPEKPYEMIITAPSVPENGSDDNLKSWMQSQFRDCCLAATVNRRNRKPLLQWLTGVMDGKGLQNGELDVKKILKLLVPKNNTLFPDEDNPIGWPDALNIIQGGIVSSPPNKYAIILALNLLATRDVHIEAMSYGINLNTLQNDIRHMMLDALRARLPGMTEDNLSTLLGEMLYGKFSLKELSDVLMKGRDSFPYKKIFGMTDESIHDNEPLPRGINVDIGVGRTRREKWGPDVEGLVNRIAEACLRNLRVRTVIGLTGDYSRDEKPEVKEWIRQSELFRNDIEQIEELAANDTPTWRDARMVWEKIQIINKKLYSIKQDPQQATDIGLMILDKLANPS